MIVQMKLMPFEAIIFITKTENIADRLFSFVDLYDFEEEKNNFCTPRGMKDFIDNHQLFLLFHFKFTILPANCRNKNTK